MVFQENGKLCLFCSTKYEINKIRISNFFHHLFVALLYPAEKQSSCRNHHHSPYILLLYPALQSRIEHQQLCGRMKRRQSGYGDVAARDEYFHSSAAAAASAGMGFYSRGGVHHRQQHSSSTTTRDDEDGRKMPTTTSLTLSSS